MPGREEGNFKIIVSLPWFVVASYERFAAVTPQRGRKE